MFRTSNERKMKGYAWFLDQFMTYLTRTLLTALVEWNEAISPCIGNLNMPGFLAELILLL